MSAVATRDLTQGKGMTERVRRLKEILLSQKGGHASVERVKAWTEAYKENVGEPAVIIQARAFDKYLSNMTIFIDENLIVGSQTKYLVGANPFPEHMCEWMLKEMELPSHLGVMTIPEEDKPVLREAVDFWRDKCVAHRAEEIGRQVFGEDLFKVMRCGIGLRENYYMTALTTIPDYGKVLNKGLDGVIKEAEEALTRLPVNGPEALQKRIFLNAMIISVNAVIKWARRYAALAREMAQKETDPQRRRELEKISEACDWVPAKPARSFYEALQSFWFVATACHILAARCGASVGRFSEYTYPFYEKDEREGGITEEEAIELLEMLLLRVQAVQWFESSASYKMLGGNQGNNWTIGGVTARGEDGTNEVDFMLLEAQRRVKGVQPTLSLLYHDKMSPEFLLKCIDVIRETGLGQPAFFNNDIFIQQMLHKHPGVSLEEARGAGIVGCIEAMLPGKEYFITYVAFNLAKLVELVVNDNVDPLTGVRVGPPTGKAEEFKSYDELHEAVRKQLRYFLPLCMKFARLGYDLRAQYLPEPFMSAVTEGCIEKGKDILSGGARYSGSGAIMNAGIDLANSMAAIKKVVFEDKVLTMKELQEALRVNFEGKEEIQRMLLQAPKYGNDDPYADEIVKEWYEIVYEEHQKVGPYPVPTAALAPEAFSIASHFGLGLCTGALPCGRKARIALTDASVSAMPGTDRNGPTALVRSAAQAIDCVKWGSNHLNMKFHPTVVKGRDGAGKLLNLVKTYMDLGGAHIQFNCLSDETLKDAQAHPENYCDLVVRVAGFSAYFIHLDKGVQDEIIKRTQLCFTGN